MQIDIALLMLEAEYIALSRGIRELVSARKLVLDLKDDMKLDLKRVGVVSKAREGNIGTQNLLKSRGPLMLARTKHLGIK